MIYFSTKGTYKQGLVQTLAGQRRGVVNGNSDFVKLPCVQQFRTYKRFARWSRKRGQKYNSINFKVVLVLYHISLLIRHFYLAFQHVKCSRIFNKCSYSAFNLGCKKLVIRCFFEELSSKMNYRVDKCLLTTVASTINDEQMLQESEITCVQYFIR